MLSWIYKENERIRKLLLVHVACPSAEQKRALPYSSLLFETLIEKPSGQIMLLMILANSPKTTPSSANTYRINFTPYRWRWPLYETLSFAYRTALTFLAYLLDNSSSPFLEKLTPVFSEQLYLPDDFYPSTPS